MSRWENQAMLKWGGTPSELLCVICFAASTFGQNLFWEKSMKNAIEKRLLTTSFAILMVFVLGDRAMALTFTTFDHPLGINGTYACGVSQGTVVGYYMDSDYDSHGFSLVGSTYKAIEVPDSMMTECHGVDNGKIVGCYRSNSNGAYHGFVYDGTSYTTIDDPDAPSWGATLACGISGKNIVGYYVDELNKNHGFLFDGSSYQQLDCPFAGEYGTVATGVSGNKVVGVRRHKPERSSE
jgi:hypothetical protein